MAKCRVHTRVQNSRWRNGVTKVRENLVSLSGWLLFRITVCSTSEQREEKGREREMYWNIQKLVVFPGLFQGVRKMWSNSEFSGWWKQLCSMEIKWAQNWILQRISFFLSRSLKTGGLKKFSSQITDEKKKWKTFAVQLTHMQQVETSAEKQAVGVLKKLC